MTRRILLVEDDRMSRDATGRVLEKLGYEAFGVRGGEEALASYMAGDFDAIVMDCQMPDMDGFRATAEIRYFQTAAGRVRIPIIGLSGRTMDGDGAAAIAAGMDDYLHKPVRMERLRTTLERWLERVPSHAATR